ncbi:MAG TPA: DUF4234 domain-containing protein [Pyrinomonadaceae bacterium]|jgi:hypothetical protein
MIYCTSCGQPNDDAASACVRCGAKFTGQAGSTPFTTAEPQRGGAQQSGPQQAGGSQRSTGMPPPQYMQQMPGASGLASVGVKRDPVMVLVLTLLTCGIYAIWWYYTYATEVKDALGREDLNPLTDLLLGFVTCGVWAIYAFFYKYPQLLMEMQRRAGLPTNDITMMTLLLGILFSPAAIFIIQSELNKIWDAANR